MFKKKDIIYAIYREGGFSKAAKALQIPQPSLSVMVSGVEKEIGAKLFDRSTNPVSLTQIGAKYLECCDGINMIEDDFRNFVSEIKGLEIGSISLGGNTLYMSNIIPGILSEYSARHPSIHINLYDYDSPSLIPLLISGDLDIAIDNLPEDDSRLASHYLGTEYLLIAVPASDEINTRYSYYSFSFNEILKNKHLTDSRRHLGNMYAFNNRSFILLQKGFDTRCRCDDVFEEYGISVRPAYELNQLSSALGMAASGLGMTIVSDTLIRHSPDWGRKMKYYAVNHERFTRDVFFYTRRNRMLSRALEAFISVSREVSPSILSSVNPQ